MNPGIKVFAPASVGNAIVGFDIMGICLEKPGDEVVVRFSDSPGLQITRITGASGKLPYEVEQNTAGLAALRLLEHLGETQRGIEMEIHKKMPFGSGLGSSAASAVAGVFAVNELLRRPLEKRDLLPFAMEGEALASGGYHADNVAPSLLGGIVLVSDHETHEVHRLPVPRGLYIAVVYPEIEILTKDARSILSANVPLKSFTTQTANVGSFIVGLYQANFDLLRKTLKDVLIEPQRAQLIPHFYEVQEAAMDKGALGCSISGAGPSMVAICANSLSAEQAAAAMKAVFMKNKIAAHTYVGPVNQEGAVKL